MKMMCIGPALSTVLVATLAAVPARSQETITIDGEKFVLKELACSSTLVERLLEGAEYCPTICNTDLVQHSVIECRAPNEAAPDGPALDREGNYVGPTAAWTITETHDLREISVSERGCQRNENETIVEVLGSTPRYYPGDPDIEDPRSAWELGIAPFDCNDHPVTIDPVTGDLVATVEIDLLIERKPFVCR